MLQRCQNSVNHPFQGLSNELQSALHDISADNAPGADNMDMDIDGIGFNIGGAPDDDGSDTEPTSPQNIVVDLRDFIGVTKWHGRRKYKDTRTWKQRIQRFNQAWASILDELVNEYIGWKYNSVSQSQPASSSANGWEFSIQIIDIYSLDRETVIYRDSETKATSALVQAGYLPASPESPTIAVSLRTLELFYATRLFKPNFSVEAFAKTLSHLRSVCALVDFFYSSFTFSYLGSIPSCFTYCSLRYVRHLPSYIAENRLSCRKRTASGWPRLSRTQQLPTMHLRSMSLSLLHYLYFILSF